MTRKHRCENDPETPSRKCSGWPDIARCLEEFPSPEVRYDEGNVSRTGWVFRGLTDSRYCLEPSIERQARSKSIPWFALQKFVELEFGSRAHFYFSPASVNLEVELTRLAQMQHYGIPTRLLDFTYSPFVALYFAIREQCDKKRRSHVRLWAIDATAVNDRFKRVVDQAEETARKRAGEEGSRFKLASPQDPDAFSTHGGIIISEIQEVPSRIAKALQPTGTLREELERQGGVAVASPPEFNHRLASQQGVFLVNCAESLSFGESLKRMMVRHTSEWCKRFDIPVKEVTDIERRLLQMNIHEQSLFPDMEGFAGFIRQKIRLHWK